MQMYLRRGVEFQPRMTHISRTPSLTRLNCLPPMVLTLNKLPCTLYCILFFKVVIFKQGSSCILFRNATCVKSALSGP